MIKVLVADDHKIFVDGLISLLTLEHNISIVAKAHNGNELIECVKKYDVDVILSDINMPEMDGKDAAGIIIKEYPDIKIIMLSMHNRTAIIKEMEQMGVHGYVLKSCDNAELVDAINTVYLGKRYFSKEVKIVLDNAKVGRNDDEEMLITARELSIIKLLCKGQTSKEIGLNLGLSVFTVDTHRKNLLIKTKCKNVVSLVNYAYKNNIVVLD
ncbi:MAG: DNA-binding response regulator [Bacteroidetes bacterium]|nr:MAG: DNA-binding response regulator [Bacteroidota bacterium]